MGSFFTILIFVSGYAVYKIIMEIVQNRKCPEDEVLRRVVLGRTKRDSKKAQKIIRHLGNCSKCQSKVDNIVNPES